MDCEPDKIQDKLDSAMPWIGLYIAAASTICTLAMGADLINGFRFKKLWFPCKFFAINAASLTVLAVALKLPVDLNTNMLKSETDFFAQNVSLLFLITALANFMTSLGSMNDGEMVANVVALVIFVLTVAGNVSIQLIELHQFLNHDFVTSIIVRNIFMLVLLTTLVSLAVAAPSIKRSLELKYQEKHKLTLSSEGLNMTRRESLGIDNQKGYMMKYLVMAETSSPQFVLARSVVCTSLASTFLFATIILAAPYIINHYQRNNIHGESPYGNYTTWILYVQSVGVVVGAISPAFRWFVAVTFKCSMKDRFKLDRKIEDFWNRMLVEWRDSFFGLQIQHNQCRKYLHDLKWLILTFLITIQIMVVLLSKLLLQLFVVLVSPFVFCYTYVMKQARSRESEHEDTHQNLSNYVLRLDGEVELPRSILTNINHQADLLIQKGRKTQPQRLLNLLHKSENFRGVEQFDTLEDRQLPNSWLMPVVTLTSIAIALPNTSIREAKQLLSSVSEGYYLGKIVERTLVKKDELVNIQKSADICWVDVALYVKWLEFDLRDLSSYIKTSNELLQKLSKRGEEAVLEYKTELEVSVLDNPTNWPHKIVAAHSMHRISQTLFQFQENESKLLFDRICVMIADILAACLTNLPHVITTMCHVSAIEIREDSVREAFLLLGKTEKVVELLREHQWPNMSHESAADIDEWRALFQRNRGEYAFRMENFQPLVPEALRGAVNRDY